MAMAKYGMATPNKHCIPGISDPIHAINTKAMTAARGKVYFIDHSLIFRLNENKMKIAVKAGSNNTVFFCIIWPFAPSCYRKRQLICDISCRFCRITAEAQAESVKI